MNKAVLLFDAGGTQTLPIAKSLYKEGYILHALYHNKWTYGYGTRYIHNKVLLDSTLTEKKYLSVLKDYILKNNITVLFPLGDNDAKLLSRYKEELTGISKFIIPDYDIFNLGYDKNSLMRICKENNYPHPKTIDLSLVNIDEIEDSIFPAILKPNFTTGGRGMKRVENKKELMDIYDSTLQEYGNCHLQEFVESGGKQIKVQIFVDDKCEMLFSSVIHKQRYYPVKGGSSSCNITIESPELVEICYNVLRSIQWVGFADFDLIEDTKDGIVKIMEINPRIPACIKSAIESGIDYGRIITKATLKEDIPAFQYLPGKSLRHIGFEMLWFIQSTDRWRSKPNWFNFFKHDLSFQDFSFADPLPFFYGLMGNLKQLFNVEFRKSKSI